MPQLHGTDLDVSLPVAAQPGYERFVAQGERAEDLGYHRVWMSETWGRNAVAVLSALAERTSDVGLGSSILPTYSRSPALLGQTAATLQEASEGRFRLGVGPSGPAVIENWHGAAFENPLRRTRETVEIVKAVLSGDEVSYDGDIFDVGGFRLRCDAPEPAPPVDVAAMGPTAVEMTGRFADGWHGVLFTPDGLEERHEDLVHGAELGDRDPSELRTHLMLTCCALEDGDRARALARQHAGFYVGGMGTYYRDSLARQGYDDVAYRIHEDWNDGRREEALAAITDELLDELSPAGTPEEARELLERFAELDALDSIAIGFPRGASQDEIDATMEHLAPEQF